MQSTILENDAIQQKAITTTSSSSTSPFYYVVLQIITSLYVQFKLVRDYNVETDMEHANRKTLITANLNLDVSDVKQV